MSSQFVSFMLQFVPILIGIAIMYAAMSIKISSRKIKIIKERRYIQPRPAMGAGLRMWHGYILASENVKEELARRSAYDLSITNGKYTDFSKFSCADDPNLITLSNERTLAKRYLYFDTNSGLFLAKFVDQTLNIGNVNHCL